MSGLLFQLGRSKTDLHLSALAKRWTSSFASCKNTSWLFLAFIINSRFKHKHLQHFNVQFLGNCLLVLSSLCSWVVVIKCLWEVVAKPSHFDFLFDFRLSHDWDCEVKMLNDWFYLSSSCSYSQSEWLVQIENVYMKKMCLWYLLNNPEADAVCSSLMMTAYIRFSVTIYVLQYIFKYDFINQSSWALFVFSAFEDL